MKISELIQKLNAIKDEEGDIEVTYMNDSEDYDINTVCVKKDEIFNSYVQIF